MAVAEGATSRSTPSSSAISAAGWGRRASSTSPDDSSSIALIAVHGSFVPGDSARTAISTSCCTANPTSWCGERALPSIIADRTAPTSSSSVALAGWTVASGSPSTT